MHFHPIIVDILKVVVSNGCCHWWAVGIHQYFSSQVRFLAKVWHVGITSS